jgi:hypothetical protein
MLRSYQDVAQLLGSNRGCCVPDVADRAGVDYELQHQAGTAVCKATTRMRAREAGRHAP